MITEHHSTFIDILMLNSNQIICTCGFYGIRTYVAIYVAANRSLVLCKNLYLTTVTSKAWTSTNDLLSSLWVLLGYACANNAGIISDIISIEHNADIRS